MYNYKGNCLLFLFLLLSCSAVAQTPVLTDSSSFVTGDTIPEKKIRKHSPTKAAIFSAIIPGAGQIYNRKYWKVPVVYAGFGSLGYLFMQNNSQFKVYRDILVNRADSNALYVDPLPNVTSDQIYAYREDFRRYRDLCFVGMFAIYVLNIVDASVDAHLFTFDVSEDLSMNVQPLMLPSASAYIPPTMGVGLTFRW